MGTGSAPEMVPLIDQVASGSPGLPAWRAALAVSCISAGDLERAVCIVNDLMAEGESVFPQDIAWLLGHSVLAEAVADRHASRQSANTRPCFHTPAGFPIWRWLDGAAVSLWLAMLAARAEWVDAAAAHFSGQRLTRARADRRSCVSRPYPARVGAIPFSLR